MNEENDDNEDYDDDSDGRKMMMMMVMMLTMIMMMAIMLRSFSLLTADKLPPSVKRAEYQLFQVQDRWIVL